MQKYSGHQLFLAVPCFRLRFAQVARGKHLVSDLNSTSEDPEFPLIGILRAAFKKM